MNLNEKFAAENPDDEEVVNNEEGVKLDRRSRHTKTIEERVAASRTFKLVFLTITGVMIAVYVGLGSLLIFNKDFLGKALSPELHAPLGVLLAGYGLFRGWRMYKTYF